MSFIVQTDRVHRHRVNRRQDLQRNIHSVGKLALSEDVSFDNADLTLNT